MAPILLIQHDIESPPGLVKLWLDKKKLPYLHHKIFETGEFPTGDYSALILMGGGMNVDQTSVYPWLDDEVEMIRKFLDDEKRILGICLGAQLCAKALGAWVGPHPHGWEVGWHPVEMLEGSARKAECFFHYHRYVFELPEGATRTAQNSWWKNQGFLWRKNLMAFQFHPETEVTWSDACAEDPHLPEVTPHVQSSHQIKTNARKFQIQSQQWFLNRIEEFFAGIES